MTAKQMHKMESHRVRHELLSTAPEIAGIKSLAGKVASYGRQLDVIDQLVDVQSQRSAAIAQRDAALQTMIDTTLEINGVALSYADENEIPGLAGQVRVFPTDFLKTRLMLRVRLAQQLFEVVQPIVPQLAEFGVTAETMTDWQAKIDAAEAAMPVFRGLVADKKAATADLVAAIRKADRLEKNQIYPLLLPLKQSNPEFYRRYAARRIVIDRPATRPAAEVTGGTPVAPAAEVLKAA